MRAGERKNEDQSKKKVGFQLSFEFTICANTLFPGDGDSGECIIEWLLPPALTCSGPNPDPAVPRWWPWLPFPAEWLPWPLWWSPEEDVEPEAEGKPPLLEMGEPITGLKDILKRECDLVAREKESTFGLGQIPAASECSKVAPSPEVMASDGRGSGNGGRRSQVMHYSSSSGRAAESVAAIAYNRRGRCRWAIGVAVVAQASMERRKESELS